MKKGDDFQHQVFGVGWGGLGGGRVGWEGLGWGD